jgi:tetratricopeptide (TPR) repeat protein
MAAGLAAIGVYALVKLIEAFRHPSIRIQNLQMKVKGRFTATGLAFIACSLAFLGSGVWGATVNYHLWRGDLIDSSITVPFATVFNAQYVPAPADKAAAQEAIAHLTTAGPASRGGIGWSHRPRTLVRLSWLHAVAGELPQAEASLAQAIGEGDPQAEWIFGLARLYMLQNKPAIEGKRLYERTLEKHPHLHEVRLALAQLELTSSNGQIAADLLLTLLADVKQPPLPQQYVRATELLIDCGMQNKALEAMRRAVEASPKIAIYHAGYATTLFYASDPKLAVESMRTAVSMEPENLGWLDRLAALEAESGDADAAAATRRRLEDLQRRLAPPSK